MRKLLPLLMFFPLLATACAGGSSRYGCPAEPGYSCKSVSEVYAETASGRKRGEEPFIKSLKNGKSARRIMRKKFPGGNVFRPGKNERSRAGTTRTAQPEKTMPVYMPPPTIRLWIAPWQDARGVFHSGKYVYLISGRGRWTIGGRTVPLGEPETGYPGNIRLRGAGRGP